MPQIVTMAICNYAIIATLLCCMTYVTRACDPDVERACPRNMAPVCATFQKNFDNPCVMEAELCRLAQAGFHFIEHRDGDCCVGPLPLLYDPTCGSDGVTHGNRWDMSYTACRNKDYVTEAAPETCPDFPEDRLRPVS